MIARAIALHLPSGCGIGSRDSVKSAKRKMSEATQLPRALFDSRANSSVVMSTVCFTVLVARVTALSNAF